MKKNRLLQVSIGTGIAACVLTAAPAMAGVISGWDMSNVTVAPPPYTEFVSYPSILFTGIDKTASNGRVTWEESDVTAPGMKVVNLDDVDGTKCIMTTGINPFDGTDKMCTDPLQSSKRWKLRGTQNDVTDVYFAVAPGATSTYRSIQKLTDDTDVPWNGYRSELGFMVNGVFVKSTAGDGLGFSTTGGAYFTSTSSYQEKEDTLSALFSQGLAGPADKYHPATGYYDLLNRFGFELYATEDEIHTGALSTNYSSLFGPWKNYSGVPFGYFYDDDDNVNTDNALMANCQGAYVITDPVTQAGYCSGSWVTYRSQPGLDVNGLPYPSDGVAKPVPADMIAAWQTNARWNPGIIEDLANLGLTYWITVGDNTTWPTPNQFVMRYYPQPAAAAPLAEVCTDAIDNDADGLIDCADLDCATNLACTGPIVEVCTDLIDNDFDGQVDCADSDCAAAANCQAPPAEICTDGVDNDGDSLIDCADSDCAGVSGCGPEGKLLTCSDGLDNDGDGFLDCADSGCAKNASCR